MKKKKKIKHGPEISGVVFFCSLKTSLISLLYRWAHPGSHTEARCRSSTADQSLPGNGC